MHLRLHSIARWCYLHNVPIVPGLIQGVLYVLFNCFLPPSVSIGLRSRLWHHGWCIAIDPNTEIGSDCEIYNQVEISSTATDRNRRAVRFIIGDRVNICTGAKIVCGEGTLAIGEGSVIAANAVVMSDVPPYSMAIGVPARCRPLKQSEATLSAHQELVR
jgi:serine O-acetyltransferase